MFASTALACKSPRRRTVILPITVLVISTTLFFTEAARLGAQPQTSTSRQLEQSTFTFDFRIVFLGYPRVGVPRSGSAVITSSGLSNFQETTKFAPPAVSCRRTDTSLLTTIAPVGIAASTWPKVTVPDHAGSSLLPATVFPFAGRQMEKGFHIRVHRILHFTFLISPVR